MQNSGKATSIELFNFRSVPMRTFHITWFTFFLCFFGWFGIAPLMPVVRDDLQLTQEQIGNIIIGSVSITIFARLFFGWLCDRAGPRIAYTVLLSASSLPIMGIGFSESYEAFLLFRLAIGITGASFVITQYHTTAMFAPNVVGTANATAAGWGNMGGGVTLMLMPLIFAAFTGAGFAEAKAWRISMVIPGAALLVMAFVYYFFTRDTPQGNNPYPLGKPEKKTSAKTLFAVCRDYRVWILFLAYGACFGIEITIDNIAILYFMDTFHLDLQEAGVIAGLFGMMNLFARALGGICGDRAGKKYGLKGRMFVLAIFLFLEGIGIGIFATVDTLWWAIAAMLGFALFLKMANGATYAVVPFINTRSVGIVSGVVGAGGNLGAVLAGFLFASGTYDYRDSFMIMGGAVAVVSCLALTMAVWKKIRADETETRSGAAIALQKSPVLIRSYANQKKA